MAVEKKEISETVNVAVRSIGISVIKEKKSEGFASRNYNIGDIINDADMPEVEKMHKVFIPDRKKLDKNGKWDGSGNWVEDTKGLAVAAYQKMTKEEAAALAKSEKEKKAAVAKAKKEMEDNLARQGYFKRG